MKIFSLLISFFVLNIATGNTEFPLDESGKYTFSDVVEVPGLSRDQLMNNGRAFLKTIKVLKSRKKHLTIDKENYQLSTKGSFYVYRYGSIKKAIDGAVEYELKIELKDDKYRYTITNFRFNEYQRNRYGKYEPIKGKYEPLEMEVSSFNKKSWEYYKETVMEKTQGLIDNIYGEMIYSEAGKSKKAKKEDNW
jgi:hypothetical protein